MTNIRYTQSHEWISVSGNTGTVGISTYAQKELGEIVYVQLPKIGQVVKAGEEIAVLESTKAAADVYAPASGTITAINTDALKDPSLINRSPESSGWLFCLELSSPHSIDHLMTKDQYTQLTK